MATQKSPTARRTVSLVPTIRRGQLALQGRREDQPQLQRRLVSLPRRPQRPPLALGRGANSAQNEVGASAAASGYPILPASPAELPDIVLDGRPRLGPQLRRHRTELVLRGRPDH